MAKRILKHAGRSHQYPLRVSHPEKLSRFRSFPCGDGLFRYIGAFLTLISVAMTAAGARIARA